MQPLASNSAWAKPCATAVTCETEFLKDFAQLQLDVKALTCPAGGNAAPAGAAGAGVRPLEVSEVKVAVGLTAAVAAASVFFL
ncbi:hypothetical protein BGX23_010685 [Mortierella sp. AD031]|nr:hypothetical protein BGX23_010685 [Mortierella sp. AD031]KAG0212135.1 hypothetical protein BGX33_003864 [Mortierella sp. NVP41]